ncbi:MAG: DHHA1 domain-containing protein, partial [Vicinamibacterales bacterium]
DLSACGGTHVARTGGIGVIAVSSWERFKSGQRLEFVCGGRALDTYRSLRDSMSSSVRLLSVLPAELPGAIERLQAEARDYKRTLAGMQNDLAQYQAEQLSARAEEITLKPGETTVAQRCRLVARAIDADANGLKTLASAIVTQPGFLVVLTSPSPQGLVLIARSADVAVSADRLLKSLVAEFGGRGGGRSELAQAGGLITTPESILGFLRSLI